MSRRTGLTAAISFAMLFALAGPLASGAFASHFRAGNLNWQKAGPATGGNQPVTFQNEQSWRGSAFGNPAVGDIIENTEGCIDFGDSTTECPEYLVTFVNAADDYVIMHALAPGSTTNRNVPHTYTTPGPFTATTTSCCTISTLNNANDATWNVFAQVNFADDESAKSTVPPIVQLPAGGVQTFTIPAIDAGGETKRFRLSTDQESCAGCGSGQPPGLTINPTTGQVTWDTTGQDFGLGLWWTGVVVESLVGGNVVSTTQIQYIIRVGGAANNQSPVWDDSVTPADGTVFTVNPGGTVNFNLKATDADATDIVQISQNSGPGTLVPTNGNPATASFSYTATAADIGNDQTVQFLAQDNGSPPLGPPFRSYTVRVVGPTYPGPEYPGPEYPGPEYPGPPTVPENPLLGCTDKKVVLIDVIKGKTRVRLRGAADFSLIGRTVRYIFTATGKKVAQSTVRADGTFSASAKLPPKRLRNSSRARYQAVIGANRSSALKLVRRVLITRLTTPTGKVRIRGRIVPPLAKPRRSVTVLERVGCKKPKVVKTFKPRASGRFNVSFNRPAGAKSAVYVLRTKVRKTRRNNKTYVTKSLPRPVIFP